MQTGTQASDHACKKAGKQEVVGKQPSRQARSQSRQSRRHASKKAGKQEGRLAKWKDSKKAGKLAGTQ
jgi:hypothetical protein